MKNMMTTLSKLRIAPISEKEIKLNLFKPNGRTNYKTKNENEVIIYEDDDYLVELLGGIQLTQIHRDILDIALYFGDNKVEKIANDGEASRLFSLYSIQKKLNYKIKNHNQFIDKKLTEIQQALFRITTKENNVVTKFNIIHTSIYSKNFENYAIIIHPFYLDFFKDEISVDYKDLLNDIVSLKHSQTKAIVRYLLTFKDGYQINIDKLLKKVGIKVSKKVFERIRKQVLEELKEVGKKFNIELIKTTDNNRILSDYTIKYTRHPKVKIYYPQK